MSEELQQVEASASLSAGFNKVRGDEPPAEVKAVEPSPTPEPVAAIEPAATPEPTPEPTAPPVEPDSEEIFPGMTKAQVKELLAKVPELEKSNRRLNGKIGELVGVIKQNQPAAAKPGTEGAPARRLQADALKRLQSEYPDLADALSEDLAGLMPEPTDPKKVEELVNQQVEARFQARTEEEAKKGIKKTHPDWEQVITTPDFRLWLQTKPEDQQEEFASTWDHGVVGDYITQFKTHRESLAKQGQRKTARLEGAVVPKGDGGASTSKLPDSAGLAAGFHRIRRPSP